eukprot:UN09841
MDLFQYHSVQFQYKIPDLYGTQFKALDLSIQGFKAYNKPWRPDFFKPLSIKQLYALSQDDRQGPDDDMDAVAYAAAQARQQRQMTTTSTTTTATSTTTTSNDNNNNNN